MTAGRFGATILGCEGLRLSAQEKVFFRDANPLGFILFARNLETADQIRALTQELRDSVGWNAPIFIDQEGGRVQRLRPPLAREWPAPLDHVLSSGDGAADVMYWRYRIISAELLSLGIDGNCAPTLDIARPETHPFLRNRCYGTELEQVVAMGRAVAQGHLDAGVFPVMKHMPGHGLAQMDSHLEPPKVADPIDALRKTDFAAFKPFADLPFGMTCHLVFQDMTDQPATVSPEMMNLIRSEIGFDGFIMTDDISMEALSGTVADRGAASLKAGCDAVLHCNGDLAEMQSLMDRVGTLSEAAQKRAERALATRKTPPQVDIDELTAKLSALEETRVNG